MVTEELSIGVDDAGRGPVLGPMIIAGVLVDKNTLPIFKKLNIKDSKQLLPGTREKLAKEIKKLSLGIEVIKISPEEIDYAVQTPGFNLNKLEAIKMAEAINRLTEARTGDKITVYVDCPSNNINAWKNVLLSYVKRKDMIFKVEHKCDVNQIECSAASIEAKVTRDEEIEKIKKLIDEDFGSGYPSDPLTVEFLKKSMKKYKGMKIFRESWQTFKNHDHSSKEKQNKLF